MSQPFRPHFLLRGGHLQTIASAFAKTPAVGKLSPVHLVTLDDGDRLVLHENQPEKWRPGDPSLLLVHGLSGSHRTSYMVRLTERFTSLGVRVFRLDMRGCGASFELATQLNHAGRSDDCLRAIEHIAAITLSGPIWAVGVSLGGAQLLKMAGELGDGTVHSDAARRRLTRLAAVAPPVDLYRCAMHMQRLRLRPYNRYFIKQLLRRIPPGVRGNPQFDAIDLRRHPRTLFELDDRLTAPLSGFTGATDYYHRSAANRRVSAIDVETLVLASKDDPIVPAGCFLDTEWSATTHLELAPGGGHVAFLGRGANRYWMDECLAEWFAE